MPIPVILDCDPGTDDALALFLALASPELSVLAITVAGGNVGLDHTLTNALALTSLARSAVPVHAGADRPLLGSFVSAPRIHGADGLAGVVLPPGGHPSAGIAADVIRNTLRTAAEPVTLVGIGPATNLALALATEPAVITNVEQIVLMTGAWGEGNVTPAAEFNAWSDPEALAILLAAGRPVVLATLELTAQALVTPARIAAWRALGTGRCLHTACDIQAHMPASPRLNGLGHPLHDPCAIAWLIKPSLFSARACSAQIDTGVGPSRGRTLIDRWSETQESKDRGSRASSNVSVLETLDAEGFFRLLGQRLASLP